MKDQQKSKRQFFGILVVSWVLMLIFAALYVQQLQKEKAWNEAGELTDVSELEALRADYASAVARYDQAEEKEAERKKVNDTVLSFLDAYFFCRTAERRFCPAVKIMWQKMHGGHLNFCRKIKSTTQTKENCFTTERIVPSMRKMMASMKHLLFLQFEK